MPAQELVIIVNPRAGAGKAARLLPQLVQALGELKVTVDLRETERPGHATDLVRQALQEGASGVGVVGGDGTLNEAVNGFFYPDGKLVKADAWLGPLPCGTGGDFRKTTGMSKDVQTMARRLAAGEMSPLDVGWMRFVDHDGNDVQRAFLNIASFGLGGDVDRIVNESPKWMGGRTAFLLGTLRAMAGYTNRGVRLTIDGGEPRESTILNMAIANGQYFGGGMHVAPRAKLDDGLFDIVAIEREGTWGNLTLTPHLYRGTLLEQEGVFHARGRFVLAEPLGPHVLLDVDGEAPGRLPATFEMRASALMLR